MLLAGGIAERDALQRCLEENRDLTMRCLVNEARGRHCKTRCLADVACMPHCKTQCLANASLGQCCKTRCWSDAPCWNHCKTVRSADLGCRNHSDLVSARMCLAEKNSKPGQQTGRSTTSKANVIKPPATQQTQNSTDHAERNVPRLAHHISKRSVWQMQLMGNIVKQRVWRMPLAGDMQKHYVTVRECGLQGTSPSWTCLRAPAEHNSK